MGRHPAKIESLHPSLCHSRKYCTVHPRMVKLLSANFPSNISSASLLSRTVCNLTRHLFIYVELGDRSWDKMQIFWQQWEVLGLYIRTSTSFKLLKSVSTWNRTLTKQQNRVFCTAQSTANSAKIKIVLSCLKAQHYEGFIKIRKIDPFSYK